jgi:hypothetical protein
MFEQRKARDAWLNGARSLQNNKQEAAQHFERALALDPGMADAWLGLHATGVREDEAITAMAEHEGRFGEERLRIMPLPVRLRQGRCRSQDLVGVNRPR